MKRLSDSNKLIRVKKKIKMFGNETEEDFEGMEYLVKPKGSKGQHQHVLELSTTGAETLSV